MSDEKPTKIIRDKYVQIRLTDAERLAIKKRAGDIGLSTFLRQLALGQKMEHPKPKPKKVIHTADPDLVRHVAWVGNNINQIAKHLNTGGSVDNDILLTLLSIQNQLEAQIQRTLEHDR